MADGDEASDPFAVPDFWKPSSWLQKQDAAADSPFFSLDIQRFQLPSSDWNEPGAIENVGFFKLPLTNETSEASEPSVDEASETSASTATADLAADLPCAVAEEDDVWLLAADPSPKKAEYRTWDSFDSAGRAPAHPVFITEAGPAAFEALITWKVDPLELRHAHRNVVETGTLCSALLSLSLGRESLLFSWHGDLRAFKPNLPDLRVAGLTATVLRGLQDQCLTCGDMMRRLRSFAEFAYSQHPTPCRVALASAIERTLGAIEQNAGQRGQEIRSILQLQALVQRSSQVLSLLDQLVSTLKVKDSDEKVLDVVFKHAQLAGFSGGYLGAVMQEVLLSMSRPLIDFVEGWIGTKPEEGVRLNKLTPGRSKGFVRVDSEILLDDFGDQMEETDFRLDNERVPGFLPDDLALPIFETGRSLRLIQSHHPDHPLVQPQVVQASSPPATSWLFDWDSILRLEQRAREYEDSLREVIREYRSGKSPGMDSARQVDPSGGSYQLQIFGAEEEHIEALLTKSMKQLNQPPIQPRQEADGLSRIVQDWLSGATKGCVGMEGGFAPEWTLLPVLSFGPIVRAQARLVSRESLRLLFSDHHLRDHLQLQRDFHLFGNGMFCSRLSHALFDPDLETAERTSGVARDGGVMGLRLSGRDTWPPASSELRLALMGVLSESYHGDNQGRRNSSGDLPGDLSFSVRGLSAEEVDRAMNPHALEALDFLRLSYKPPLGLGAIITPAILMQYDGIFRLLLQVLRMVYTVNQLFRDVTARSGRGRQADGTEAGDTSRRFSIEARHFVYGISSYFMDVGVAEPWKAFEERLRVVEKRVNDDGEDDSDEISGPDRLRDYHSDVLDRIMLALLLRKRQKPVLGLLEEIFGVVLQFAQATRLATRQRAAGTELDGGPGTAQLYNVFRKKVEVFITVCKGLMEKGNYGTKRADGAPRTGGDGHVALEGNTIAQLLMRLDMFDYYVKSRG